ncbi:MAG: DUF1460 domain-containing protein [Candidatus Hydrogenedentes bacterium]|nr:DUF1460 domain-containing protein [Candidatus Hydrogenedentota bacterium]
MTSSILILLVASAPLFESNEAEVDAFLLGLRGLSFEARLVETARAFVGAPYKDGPLGEGPEGKYDKDPLIDLTCADCVTFVEQTIALAASETYQEAFTLLQHIRYKDGRIDFETRNHFMAVDWVANNAWCHDVTDTLGVSLAQVTRTISKRGFFERVHAPELGRDTPDADMTLAYVPLDQVERAAARVPSPCLFLLIGKADWLFAVHCGLFVRDGEGKAHFYHASSKAGAVIDDDLVSYLRDSTRHLGFAAYRVDAPGAPN